MQDLKNVLIDSDDVTLDSCFARGQLFFGVDRSVLPVVVSVWLMYQLAHLIVLWKCFGKG